METEDFLKATRVHNFNREFREVPWQVLQGVNHGVKLRDLRLRPCHLRWLPLCSFWWHDEGYTLKAAQLLQFAAVSLERVGIASMIRSTGDTIEA